MSIDYALVSELEVGGLDKERVIAHRCEKSLSRYISIRYCNPYSGITGVPECGDFRWWLLKHDHNFDYDSHYLQPITPVELCPFCGEELKQYSN